MPIPDLSSVRHWRFWDAHVPIWYDAEYRLPLTGFGRRWALEPRRADLVAWHLLEDRWISPENLRTPARARYEDIGRIHSEDYLDQLSSRETLAQVFGVDPWDVPVDELMRSVRLGVGGTLAAVREALARRGPAVNLLGGFHHAGPDWGSGLCALNDVAVALAAIRHEGFAGRAVILDLDAHPPDGTAACLAGTADVWIGSLSGGATHPIAGTDETILPAGCDDTTYLAALEALLGRMPPPDVAFVVAGGDVLAGDHLGGLGLSLDGARRRDLRVARALRSVPSVWLPGGGYHPRSWHLLAGTVLALLRHTRLPIDAREDPLSVRFASLARHLERQRPSDGRKDLTLADIESDLGVGAESRRLLFGVFSAEAVEYSLHRFNLLSFLERRGYGPFRVALATASGGGERASTFGQADGHEHLLIDCVLERGTVGGRGVLYVHWLALRDPRARFSARRPRLPGQDVPGLGLAREMMALLVVMARRLDLAGLAFKPAWYHTAYVARQQFRFHDPGVQGRFEAMLRDLAGVGLVEISTAIAGGRVRLNGQPYKWEAEDMVWWQDPPATDEAAVAEVRDHSVFTISAPSARDELALGAGITR
jgi:acetoin utilization deacetylase AcuC-like enzyme